MKNREQLILAEMMKEYESAKAEYSPFTSHHEGWAVIKEQLDEVWDEIKKKRGTKSQEKIMKEVLHVGAMSLRFLMELTPLKLETKEKKR
jgi:hypothetical protein